MCHLAVSQDLEYVDFFQVLDGSLRRYMQQLTHVRLWTLNTSRGSHIEGNQIHLTSWPLPALRHLVGHFIVAIVFSPKPYWFSYIWFCLKIGGFNEGSWNIWYRDPSFENRPIFFGGGFPSWCVHLNMYIYIYTYEHVCIYLYVCFMIYACWAFWHIFIAYVSI